MSSMIMSRLKEETAQAHKDTEKYSYGAEIMSGTLILDQYTDIILKNYWLHKHFEPILIVNENLNSLFDAHLNKRMKLDVIEQDLKKLDTQIPADWSGLPIPNNVAQCLGCMYVLEGSALGGAMIQRALSKNEPIASRNAFGFYTFYGQNLGSMWKQFGEIVTKFAMNEVLEEEIVQFANETFKATELIFSKSIERIAT